MLKKFTLLALLSADSFHHGARALDAQITPETVMQEMLDLYREVEEDQALQSEFEYAENMIKVTYSRNEFNEVMHKSLDFVDGVQHYKIDPKLAKNM